MMPTLRYHQRHPKRTRKDKDFMSDAPNLTTNTAAPAPWRLHGDGYVFLYQFNAEWVAAQGFVPEPLRPQFRGGIGALMLVRYRETPVGPYDELLFIPGLFEIDGAQYHSITKIYVSTQTSVVNGQNNWGVPKERADFTFKWLDDVSERVNVTLPDGEAIAEFTVINEGGFRIPINTQLLPLKPVLGQQWDGQLFITSPFSKGTIQFATLQHTRINAAHFPSLGHLSPMVGSRATDFELHFPPATIKPIQAAPDVAESTS
jgi:hypothetical protein